MLDLVSSVVTEEAKKHTKKPANADQQPARHRTVPSRWGALALAERAGTGRLGRGSPMPESILKHESCLFQEVTRLSSLPSLSSAPRGRAGQGPDLGARHDNNDNDYDVSG